MSVPQILVVCTHNAGRSVAARVLLDHYGDGRVTVRSAGSAPGDEVNPSIAKILTERGLDVSKEFPKPLTDEAARAADIIITMGCGDACPVYPGKRYIDWELPDPAGKGVEEVRPIVDEIEQRVLGLLAELERREIGGSSDANVDVEQHERPRQHGEEGRAHLRCSLQVVEVVAADGHDDADHDPEQSDQ